MIRGIADNSARGNVDRIACDKVMRDLLKHLPLPPKHFLFYWGLLLGALYLFTELAEDVYQQEGFFFDQPLLTWLSIHQSPTLTSLALSLSFSGSAYVLTPLTLLLLAVLWRVSRREALFFVLAFGGAVALNLATKALFARPRPEFFPQIAPEASFSFPSGHTMASTAFFLALYLIARRHAPRYRWLVAALSLAMVLGISLSRPYLQVHYPSDIAAGWTLSSAWVLLVNAYYERRQRG